MKAHDLTASQFLMKEKSMVKRSSDGSFYGDALSRYRNDAGFHALVDSIKASGMSLGYTPGEIRDAAFVACVIIEMETLQPFGFSSPAASQSP